jgi:excinuclease ABC subunit C
MQDEVHRFAITFHQSLRNKNMKSSLLDDIKGLGSKRKELLNKAYPDISLLKEATVEELSQLLPKDVAEELYNKLH